MARWHRRTRTSKTGSPAPSLADPASTLGPIWPDAEPALHHRPRPAPTPVVAVGLLAAAASALLFGANGSLSKIVMSHGLTSQQFVALRASGAALVIVVLALSLRPRQMRTSRRELPFLAFNGVVGVGMVQWLYFVAIARLPVGIALLLEYTAPLLVALWVRFVRRQVLSRWVWVALVLCLAGLSLVAGSSRGTNHLDTIGVAAALASALALAVYYLSGERVLATRDPLTAIAWLFSFGGLWWALVTDWRAFPVQVLRQPIALPSPLPAISVSTWVLCVVVIVFGTLIPYGLVLIALKHLGSARTGLLGMSEPLCAAVIAWLVLGEVLTDWQMIGGMVVLSGIAIAELVRGKKNNETLPDVHGPDSSSTSG